MRDLFVIHEFFVISKLLFVEAANFGGRSLHMDREHVMDLAIEYVGLRIKAIPGYL